MNLFLQKIVNSIIQIMLFTLIPFVWWFLTSRKKCGFLSWIGLKPVPSVKEKTIKIWIVGTTAAFFTTSVFLLILVKNVETAASEFAGLGAKAIPAIIIYAVFNTSLSEELLFRGFLLKRLSHQWSFKTGNIIQASLFSLLHGAMFFSLTGTFQIILIMGFTGGIAWCMGYINEQKAKGSILPSWSIHAIANIFSGLCSAFLII